MRIAIADRSGSFSDHWIAYCEEKGIPYKCVNPYDNNIVELVADCDAFMWHHHHGNYRDVVYAKQLLFSLQQAGMVVFPDFNTGWHFDDKLGQKYLFEALQIPSAKAWAFYDKECAYRWISNTTFPKVFKLRGGAGSANVKLARTPQQAKRFVRKAFGRGYSATNPLLALKTEWNRFITGKGRFYDVAKYIALLLFPGLKQGNMLPRHKGYVYFQEFIPNDGFDIRVIVINDKAFAIRREVREGDFRASGSGLIRYEKELFSSDVILRSFVVARQLKTQVVALDYIVNNQTEELLLAEISYGYSYEGYVPCPGYWTEDLVWHEGHFNSCHWMVDSIIQTITKKSGNEKCNRVECPVDN